jgi:hypothetical protein
MTAAAASPSTTPSTTPSTSPASEDDRRSLGTLVGDIGKDLSTLMRQEVALAKAEAKQSANKAGKGIGLYAGAGVAGLLFLVFLSVAVWWGLGNSIGRGWSGLIVAVIWAIIAVILALAARANMRKIRGLPDTAETVKRVPPALKGQERPGDNTTGTPRTENH